MSGKGVLRDNEMRDAAEKQLQTTLDLIESRMEEAVPLEARDLKIYKKAPKTKTGLIELNDYPVKYCGDCGIGASTSRWKKHASLCGGATTEMPEATKVWGKPLEFKVSRSG
jgi:hypothetical protein